MVTVSDFEAKMLKPLLKWSTQVGDQLGSDWDPLHTCSFLDDGVKQGTK